MLKLFLVLLLSFQQPPDEVDDGPDVLWVSEEPSSFDPATLGMQPVQDPTRLFELLTADGRCPVRKVQKAPTPCALISYAPPGTDQAAYENSLRPVFKVESRDAVWTFIDGKLVKTSISKLISVSDLNDQNDAERVSYSPTAILGYQENRSSCSRASDSMCLAERNFMWFGRRPDILTPGCIEQIWKPKGGPRDPGEQTRCKFGR